MTQEFLSSFVLLVLLHPRTIDLPPAIVPILFIHENWCFPPAFASRLIAAILRLMRAVIFDMDGLMIDSEKVYWEAGRQIARDFGKTVSNETLGRMMGRKPLESIALFAQTLGITKPHEVLLSGRARARHGNPANLAEELRDR